LPGGIRPKFYKSLVRKYHIEISRRNFEKLHRKNDENWPLLLFFETGSKE